MHVLLARPQPLRLRALRHLGRWREVGAMTPLALFAAPSPRRRSSRRDRSAVRRRRGGDRHAARRRGPGADRRGRPAGDHAAGAGRRRRAGRARGAGRRARTPRRSAAARAGPTRAAFSFGGTTDSTRMPSTSFSVSTRNWSPTAAPPGRIEPSSTPRGSRARPRARSTNHRGRAGQLDLDADGHGPPPYRLAPRRLQRARRYGRAVPIYALGDQVPDIDPTAYVHPMQSSSGRCASDRRARCGPTPCCAATTARSASAPAPACRTAPCCTRRQTTRPSSATSA